MKKKIAILTPGFKPVPAVDGGGVENLITHIIDENEKKHIFDIDVYTIYSNKISNCNYKNTNLVKIKYNKIINNIFRIINYILKRIKINYVFLYLPKKYINLINSVKYDKIIVENNMVLYRKVHKKYRYKCDFFFHMHNNINDQGKSPKDAKYIAKTAKKIIFVSNAMKRAFNKCTNTKSGTILYNAIDFGIFNVDLNKKQKLIRNKLSINSTNYNFLYMGRVYEGKGVDELVDAFNRLNGKYNKIHLSIIGFGFSDLKNSYEKKIIDKVKNENISLYGFLPATDLIEHIVASDCIVIPSTCEEAFGLVSLEAMAMRKTIISSNAGGLPETLDNNTALIINKNNISNELYYAMEKVVSDKVYSEKLALNAYNKVLSTDIFNKEYYYDNFCKIIK